MTIAVHADSRGTYFDRVFEAAARLAGRAQGALDPLPVTTEKPVAAFGGCIDAFWFVLQPAALARTRFHISSPLNPHSVLNLPEGRRQPWTWNRAGRSRSAFASRRPRPRRRGRGGIAVPVRYLPGPRPRHNVRLLRQDCVPAWKAAAIRGG